MNDQTNQCQSASCGSNGLVRINLAGPPAADTQKSIPATTARLTFKDRIGALRARCGIGRDRYRVSPGLYSMGNPDANSVVLVTANYKLSFDILRKELTGLSAWILVLDTHGINVWCAAGKGTFGTEELVRRMKLSALSQRVCHRTIILPQLGAPGVSAHTVKKETGFNVIYGPVRARDIRRFLADGRKANPDMRRVTFGIGDRLAVIPEELVQESKLLVLVVAALALWKLGAGDFSASRFLDAGIPTLGAFLAGTVAAPLLLPWIPFRSFALKGWLVGLLWTLGVGLFQNYSQIRLIGSLLLFPAISAYLALNFTGSTTFTSQSGVNKEIRMFARPIAASGIVGVIVLASAYFI